MLIHRFSALRNTGDFFCAKDMTTAHITSGIQFPGPWNGPKQLSLRYLKEKNLLFPSKHHQNIAAYKYCAVNPSDTGKVMYQFQGSAAPYRNARSYRSDIMIVVGNFPTRPSFIYCQHFKSSHFPFQIPVCHGYLCNLLSQFITIGLYRQNNFSFWQVLVPHGIMPPICHKNAMP